MTHRVWPLTTSAKLPVHESCFTNSEQEVVTPNSRNTTEIWRQRVVIYQYFSIFAVVTGGPAHELAEAWHCARLTCFVYFFFFFKAGYQL